MPTTVWCSHDDAIKWRHFPRYWPFVRGIHQYLVNSPHKGQWRAALMFSLICVRINGWVQWWGRWIEMLSRPLWRHRNGYIGAHDDIIKRKHFLHYWHYFVQEIPCWAVNSPHKGQWRVALMFSLICAWTNGCANNQDTNDLQHHCVYYATVINLLQNTQNMTSAVIGYWNQSSEPILYIRYKNTNIYKQGFTLMAVCSSNST